MNLLITGVNYYKNRFDLACHDLFIFCLPDFNFNQILIPLPIIIVLKSNNSISNCFSWH